jgi:hypothetical protein
MKHFITACLLITIASGFISANPNDEKPKPGKIDLAYLPSSSQNERVKAAIKQVHELFEDKNKRAVFMNAVGKVKDFTYTFERADSITTWVFHTDLKLKIRGYNGGDETRTLAYVTSEYPNNIFINLNKVDDRSISSIAATIVHEMVHSVDRIKTDARFGHSGNSSRGKQNSAPYAIGRIASLVVRGDISTNKNNTSAQLLKIMNLPPEEDLFIIEESEEIDESRVSR